MAAQDQPYKPQIPRSQQAPQSSKKQPPTSTISVQTPRPPKKEASPVVSIIGIILTSLVLFFSGYFYLQYLQDQNIEERKNMETGEKQKEEEMLKQIEENVKNDQIRKLDITTINKGLKEYFKKNNKYPKNLEALTPNYLRVISLDPVTKEVYAYVPNKDFSGYTLSAKLSNGSIYSLKAK